MRPWRGRSVIFANVARDLFDLYIAQACRRCSPNLALTQCRLVVCTVPNAAGRGLEG